MTSVATGDAVGADAAETAPRASRAGTLQPALLRHLRGQRLFDGCCGVLVACAYLLSQANQGLRGDARIYIGRALADLDPNGVGRDLMFLHDGQSAFSVFRFLARAVAAALGLDVAITALTLASAVAWAVAMLTVVRAVRPGRATLVVLAAALLLPRVYTPWNIIAAGEALAEPRPLAEAVVLLALASLLAGRQTICLALLVGAAVIHPIMALPGFAVVLVVVGRTRWRRWTALAFIAAGGVFAAGALGVPLLSRLFIRVDPAWLAILHERSAYLFMRSWPAETVSTVLVQLSTILLASCLVEGPLRLAFRAIVAVAVAGCALTVAFCDAIPLLLVVQVQPWRALWMAAAVAPFAAGICLWKLSAAGDRGRAALAMLAAAWICIQAPPAGPLLAVAAFGLVRVRGATPSRRMLAGIYAIALLASVPVVAMNVALLARYLAVKPATMPMPLIVVWAFAMPAPLLVALAFACSRHPRAAVPRALVIALVAPALILVANRWEDRTPAKIDADGGFVKADLVRLLDARKGEVLWLGGDELWYWTRRPQWNAALQGAGIVFSRDMAILWERRTRAVVEHGLAHEEAPGQASGNSAGAEPRFDRDRIDDLCRRSDAPAWVVQPLAAGAPAPDDGDVAIWTAPIEDRQIIVSSDGLAVRSVQRWAIVPCAAVPVPRDAAAR